MGPVVKSTSPASQSTAPAGVAHAAPSNEGHTHGGEESDDEDSNCSDISSEAGGMACDEGEEDYMNSDDMGEEWEEEQEEDSDEDEEELMPL